MSEAEFNEQFKVASVAGKASGDARPEAAAARYDRESRRMVIEMQNGVSLLVPIDLIQGLRDADDNGMSDFQLVAGGSQIHWGQLDVQFYIEDLLRGVFGTPNWMSSVQEHLAEIGRKGGSSRSVRKAATSRANGAKGGRPARKIA